MADEIDIIVIPIKNYTFLIGITINYIVIVFLSKDFCREIIWKHYIIGRNIRARRKRRGLSQKQLGGRVGVTFQQVQKYEAGTNMIRPSKLKLIAEILGCNLHELFYEQENQSLPPEITSPAKLEEYRLQGLLRDFFTIDSPALQEHIRIIIHNMAKEHKRQRGSI